MSLFDQAPHEPQRFDPAAHPARTRLRDASRRLRRRLIAANAAIGLAAALAPPPRPGGPPGSRVRWPRSRSASR